jgi:hypothetical protein
VGSRSGLSETHRVSPKIVVPTLGTPAICSFSVRTPFVRRRHVRWTSALARVAQSGFFGRRGRDRRELFWFAETAEAIWKASCAKPPQRRCRSTDANQRPGAITLPFENCISNCAPGAGGIPSGIPGAYAPKPTSNGDFLHLSPRPRARSSVRRYLRGRIVSLVGRHLLERSL